MLKLKILELLDHLKTGSILGMMFKIYIQLVKHEQLRETIALALVLSFGGPLRCQFTLQFRDIKEF